LEGNGADIVIGDQRAQPVRYVFIQQHQHT
jgi:hypothetical protein